MKQAFESGSFQVWLEIANWLIKCAYSECVFSGLVLLLLLLLLLLKRRKLRTLTEKMWFNLATITSDLV